MKVVLYLPRRPKSANSKQNKLYRDAIYQQARQQAAGSLLVGPLYSRIIWFHRYSTDQGDVDNILKPIHDALKGAAFADDRSIVRTASFSINSAEAFILDSDPFDPEAGFELLRHLDAAENRDILYIEVGQQVDTRVRLGPIL